MKKGLLAAVLLACAATTFYFCKTDTKPTVLTGNKTYVRLSGEPERLNPLTTEEANAMQVMSYMFPTLLDFDPKTLELTPVLAKSRPIIATIDTGKLKGGTSYTYEIRDEAMWDNGTPVTAADFVFTVKATFQIISTRFRVQNGFNRKNEIGGSDGCTVVPHRFVTDFVSVRRTAF